MEMQVLVLTVTFGLIPALQALDPLSLALEGLDVTGTWYVKAIVADKGLPKEKRPKEVSPMMVDILDGGYLEASFTFMKKGQCHGVKVVMRSTEEPGKFSLLRAKQYVYIKPLPVKDHFILYFDGQIHGRRFRGGKLIGRSPDVNPEALEAFQKFTQRKGLLSEDIFLPTQTESCVPESD